MFALFESLTNFLWGLPLLIIILATGIIFTVRSRFFQFRYFGKIVTNIFKCDRDEEKSGGKKLTSFQAIAIAVGGSVGVSNMSGVATAIATGGPGALFWLWIAAFFGMIIKMAEVSLAVYYRETTPEGEFHGGPSYYMQKALGEERGMKIWFPLALIFGLGIFSTWFITIQNYTISEAVGTTFNIPMLAVSLFVVICIYAVTIGGVKKLGMIAQYLVPVMCIFYIVASAFILITNFSLLPNTFYLIFKGAFTKQAAVGGFAGAGVAMAMRLGFARSVFSNEAGWGTSPMVHASANTDHPIKQGLLGAFEVFADTMVVCTLTGLVVITTGYWSSGLLGADLTLSAFESVMGHGARALLAVTIFLFGLTTSTGWYAYYRTLLDHAFKGSEKVRKTATAIFVIGNPLWGFLTCFVTVVFGGTPKELWVFADFTSLVPTLVNVFTLLIIGGKFIELLNDYKARYLGIGKVDPNFKLFYEDKVNEEQQNAEQEAVRSGEKKTAAEMQPEF